MEAVTKTTALTPEEVGTIIGCSAYTVKDLARRKCIPHYKVGNMYRFTRSAILEWIRKQEEKNYVGSDRNGKY